MTDTLSDIRDSYTVSQKIISGNRRYFNFASQEQSDAVAHVIENEFLKPGGLISTIETTNEQWDAPNDWAPLQRIAVIGLANYGHLFYAQ